MSSGIELWPDYEVGMVGMNVMNQGRRVVPPDEARDMARWIELTSDREQDLKVARRIKTLAYEVEQAQPNSPDSIMTPDEARKALDKPRLEDNKIGDLIEEHEIEDIREEIGGSR